MDEPQTAPQMPAKRQPRYTLGGLVKPISPPRLAATGEPVPGPFRIIAIGDTVLGVMRRLTGPLKPEAGTDDLGLIPIENCKPYAVKRDKTPRSLGAALQVIRKLKSQLEACQRKAHTRRGEAAYNQRRIDTCKALLRDALGFMPDSVVDGIGQLTRVQQGNGLLPYESPAEAREFYASLEASGAQGRLRLAYSRNVYASLLYAILKRLGVKTVMCSDPTAGNLGAMTLKAFPRIDELLKIEAEYTAHKQAVKVAAEAQKPVKKAGSGQFHVFGSDAQLRAGVNRARARAGSLGYAASEYAGALTALAAELGVATDPGSLLGLADLMLAEIRKLRLAAEGNVVSDLRVPIKIEE